MTDSDKLLDGARIAREIRDEVATRVASLAQVGVTPRLDVVLVGEDPASKVYVGSKAKTCVELGMRSRTHELPASTHQAEVEGLVERLHRGQGDAAGVEGRDARVGGTEAERGNHHPRVAEHLLCLDETLALDDRAARVRLSTQHCRPA